MEKDIEKQGGSEEPINFTVPYGASIVFESEDGDPNKTIVLKMYNDQLYAVRNSNKKGQSFAQAVTQPVSNLKECMESKNQWLGPSLDEQFHGKTCADAPDERVFYDSNNRWW